MSSMIPPSITLFELFVLGHQGRMTERDNWQPWDSRSGQAAYRLPGCRRRSRPLEYLSVFSVNDSPKLSPELKLFDSSRGTCIAVWLTTHFSQRLPVRLDCGGVPSGSVPASNADLPALSGQIGPLFRHVTFGVSDAAKLELAGNIHPRTGHPNGHEQAARAKSVALLQSLGRLTRQASIGFLELDTRVDCICFVAFHQAHLAFIW